MTSAAKKFGAVALLTCRDPATDFRLPLAEELQALGEKVYYIHLKRRPVVRRMDGSEPAREFSLTEFLKFFAARFRSEPTLLVFNSTNLVFPVFSRLLRFVAGGFWVLDMHDELTYGKTGLARFKALVAQRMLIGGSDLVVHAAPTLSELFPGSRHLGNASTLTAIDRPEPDFSRVLILASIDERFDFAFLIEAARQAPDLAFEIHGQISANDPDIRKHVEDTIATQPNVHYMGPYVNSDLPRILGDYVVTLAPYATPSPLTHYIDPLRYYHCLNSGMEVISTPIPKARDFGDSLHIVRRPDEVASLVKGLANGSVAKRNAGSTADIHNWRARAKRLLAFVSEVRSGSAPGANPIPNRHA